MYIYVFHIFFWILFLMSVAGQDRGGAGEGERLYPGLGGRAGEPQRSGTTVEDAAASYHAGVSGCI